MSLQILQQLLCVKKSYNKHIYIQLKQLLLWEVLVIWFTPVEGLNKHLATNGLDMFWKIGLQYIRSFTPLFSDFRHIWRNPFLILLSSLPKLSQLLKTKRIFEIPRGKLIDEEW